MADAEYRDGFECRLWGRQRQFAARIPGNVGIRQLSTHSFSNFPIDKRTAYFLRL
jgi:hypothetical protein